MRAQEQNWMFALLFEPIVTYGGLQNCQPPAVPATCLPRALVAHSLQAG